MTLLQSVGGGSGLTLPQLATVVGIISTVLLLAGNLIMGGIFLGRITANLKAHSEEIRSLALDLKRLVEKMVNHESRISNMEGRAYGRRKDDV